MKEKTLTDEQLEAIEEIENNLQIIACAGSGKTEVITRRIANILKKKPDVKPDQIVAFTFTEKAAKEMKNRISQALGNDFVGMENMYVGTIHGYCYWLLCKYTEKFSEYKILDTVKNHLFVERYNKECGMNDLELSPYPININLFLQCIEKMVDDYENRENWEEKNLVAFKKYMDCLYNHNYIDFSLLIFEAIRQIKENTNVQSYLSTIKYLVIDEYQDIDDIQEKVIKGISEFGANVCVVGDDDQTIYQFRGSNANNMINFSNRYPNVHQVKLEKNFRSVPGIVDIADAVINHNHNRLPKKMESNLKDISTVIKAARYTSEQEEYTAIATQIKTIHKKGIPFSEIAILVRKGKFIPRIANILKKESIPVETSSAEQFFNGEYFTKFVTTLQILSDVDKAKLYECWHEITDDKNINTAYKFLRSCLRGGHLRISQIIDEFCEKIDFINSSAIDIEERLVDLNGIKEIADDYDEIYGDWQISARIGGLLKFLGTHAAAEYKYHNFNPNTEDDAVQLMTVHKSKGLEFDTVFLPELMNREFPVSNMGGKKYWSVLGGTFKDNKDKYESDMEDERKLFYVAITRAKRNLYLSYDLSTQPISAFVKESAGSNYLIINRDDLTYNPKPKPEKPLKTNFYEKNEKSKNHEEIEEKRAHWEEERQQKQEYWERVRYARRQLYDYYGTASHFFPGARGDLAKISSMTPDEILEDASSHGLI